MTDSIKPYNNVPPNNTDDATRFSTKEEVWYSMAQAFRELEKDGVVTLTQEAKSVCEQKRRDSMLASESGKSPGDLNQPQLEQVKGYTKRLVYESLGKTAPSDLPSSHGLTDKTLIASFDFKAKERIPSWFLQTKGKTGSEATTTEVKSNPASSALKAKDYVQMAKAVPIGEDNKTVERAVGAAKLGEDPFSLPTTKESSGVGDVASSLSSILPTKDGSTIEDKLLEKVLLARIQELTEALGMLAALVKKDSIGEETNTPESGNNIAIA